MIRRLIRRQYGAAALAALVLAGCSVPRIPGVTPYKPEIQQGNFISQDMVSTLKPGMTREQVRAVLGTPMLTDVFHASRWDYIWWREEPSGKRETRRLVVHFEGDRLARLSGDVVPARSVQ
jgi:outer membrane protein assembly factor BamE